MAAAVMIDGSLVPPDEARVSVFDRGFLYGDSVFETIRTYAGKPFALAEHLARLERSAALVHIPLPIPLPELQREIERALAHTGNAESYVRVMITRGQGELGLDPNLADVPLRVIIINELVPLPEEVYSEGVSVVTFPTMRVSDATFAEGAKIGNYLVAVLAMRVARQRGAHEALITNQAGRAVEGASSNLFFVRGGVVFTPPEECGILLGITRARAIETAEQLGLRVEYEVPSVEELAAADEVFISSSIRELVPVVRVDDRRVADGRPGPITQRLIGAFRGHVRAAADQSNGG